MLVKMFYFLPRVKICFYFHTLGHENIEKKDNPVFKNYFIHTYISIYTHMYTHIHTYKYAHYIFLWESRNTPLAWRQMLAAWRKNHISVDGILEAIFLPRSGRSQAFLVPHALAILTSLRDKDHLAGSPREAAPKQGRHRHCSLPWLFSPCILSSLGVCWGCSYCFK